jgi:hypothetical protein
MKTKPLRTITVSELSARADQLEARATTLGISLEALDLMKEATEARVLISWLLQNGLEEHVGAGSHCQEAMAVGTKLRVRKGSCIARIGRGNGAILKGDIVVTISHFDPGWVAGYEDGKHVIPPTVCWETGCERWSQTALTNCEVVVDEEQG